MPQDQPVPGPIDGLRLPRRAWKALQQESITTLDQLRAVAGRIERILPGIGHKTAGVIRAELARIQVRDKPTGLSGSLDKTLTHQR